MTLRLSVTVTAGAKRSEVVGAHGTGWKVRVAEAPERGRANEALTELLASVLEVPRDSVRIVAGHTSRRKIVEIEGVADPEARRRLSGGES